MDIAYGNKDNIIDDMVQSQILLLVDQYRKDLHENDFHNDSG